MNENIIIEFNFSHSVGFTENEYANVEEYLGKIYLSGEDDVEKLIGNVELHLYKKYYHDKDCDLYMAFDRSLNTIEVGDVIIDQDTGSIKDEFEMKYGEDTSSFNILVIQELMLFAEFRNKGYGKKVILGIHEIFDGKCCYLVLKSFPMQHEMTLKGKRGITEQELSNMEKDYKIAQKKLNNFYKSCGFDSIKGNPNYFIKNISDYKIPEEDE